MYRISRSALRRYSANRAKRWAQPLTKRQLRQAARAMWPMLATLAFASAAHAQGTMDFSGAQTLMTTFNYRNDYLGVEQWSRFITGRQYAYNAELHCQHEEFAKLWDANLRSQGFAEVFTDKCIVG